MERKKILGYRKFVSKAGAPTCIVQVLGKYSEHDKKNGAVGEKAEDIWVPEEYQSQINVNCVGKTLSVSYTIQNGRAYINGLVVE